jgi:hypothetical protein
LGRVCHHNLKKQPPASLLQLSEVSQTYPEWVDGSPAKDQKEKKIQSKSSPVHLIFSPTYNP